MNTSTMYKDFIKAQKEFEPALKKSTNPHFRSKYADLGECIDAVKDALNNNNFSLMQKTYDNETGVAVETIFLHESGEFISSGILKLPAAKQDPQGYGSALTYARRYSLMSACGIAAEDDDANLACKTQALKQAVYSKPTTNKETNEGPDQLFIKQAKDNAKKGTEEFTKWAKTLNEEQKKVLEPFKQSLWSEAKDIDNLNRLEKRFDATIIEVSDS